MNWKNFRRYSGLMTRVEKTVIFRRFREWCAGHATGDITIDKNWSDTEAGIASMMFKAGWIAARIESEDDPILREWGDD